MNKYIILADVTCDLSEEIRNSFGIKNYVNGHIHLSDGRDFPTTLDWSKISKEEFYSLLSNKKFEITTAPPTPDEYYEVFKRYVQEGYGILSVSISSKISSTYDASCVAAKKVKEEIPEANIYCFDSMRMAGALGLLLLSAYEFQNNGKSMQEVIDWLEANKNRVHQMGPIDDLMYVARRGRISKGKAIMGSFAGVKPMGDCNTEGYVTVLGKAKGIKKALDVTVKYIKEMATDVENDYILISHSNRDMYAQTMKTMLTEQLGAKKVLITDVFDATAPHIGPGMVGVYFFGKAVSEDCNEEKELMDKLLGK